MGLQHFHVIALDLDVPNFTFNLLSQCLLDTPCAAGARSTGRLNILYQFGLIRGQYLMVIRFNQCFHGCLHYRIQKVISEHYFLRDATNVSSKQCHFCTVYQR